ncbi:MAG: hypothetical protein Q8Q24_02200 [bacterium]|nr:hypothetical protein [bacterium]
MDFKNITESIFYVTPDPGRAIGLEKVLPNFHIVCLDNSPMVGILEGLGVEVFSLERELGETNERMRNSGMILAYPLVQDYIKEHSSGATSNILYFKPSRKIEKVADEKGYRLLGNPPEMNELFEDKISFYKLCREWNLPIPKGETAVLKNQDYQKLQSNLGSKLVIQFGHGWAGNSTFFANSEDEFINLQKKFPERIIRITSFIFGNTYLNNICITRKQILISDPAIQVNALDGFSSNPGATCGRQWPSSLPENIKREIGKYSEIIANRMKGKNYLGIFGLDFIVEEGTGKVYVSENNARLTASIPLYTKMELKNNLTPLLVFHILAFLNKEEVIWESKSLAGGELLIRNNLETPVLIKDNFPIGIYQIKDSLTKIRNGYSFEDISDESEFLLVAQEKGRSVESGNELAKIISLGPILDDSGNAKIQLIKALEEVKSKII